jgi:type I restriction enzyme R subunit
MKNFDFLKELTDFKALYSLCAGAEEYVVSNPTMSAVFARKALENLIKSFYTAKYGGYSADSNLFSLIEDAQFKAYFDESLISCVHFVRKMGNNADHQEEISPKRARECLKALHEAVKQVLFLMGACKNVPAFDTSVYNAKSQKVMVALPEEEAVIDEKVLEKYKTNIIQGIEQKSSIDFTEYETRKLYIDEALKEAGWQICQTPGATTAGLACIEVRLLGMPNKEGFGFADYVLFDNDGVPLAVVEAKKTSVDEVAGSQQARLYADCIEKKWGRRPVIFYTNGYSAHVVDCAGYPARKVYGFYSKQELQSLLNRRNLSDIQDTRVDKNISDRPFIQQAATAVCESFNKKARKALLVMATGTGKTRCAISIVDVLQRARWANKVLFLADRTALVKQARDNFKKYLPDSTLCTLSEEKEDDRDYNARITLSTYQTMLNIIDREDKKYGVAHFDLIILDECHRSIYNKYKAVFHYFDSLLLGLTATPREQIDKSTYDVFDLSKGEPTFAYDYKTAVKEGYLTDFHAFERTTNILKNGLKYDDLSDEEKEQYENLFSVNGVFPKEIDAQLFQKTILNHSTIDRVLQTLMNEGLHIKGGETLGKTIIFAHNHRHAEEIVRRFNVLYPEKGNDFCKLIDNYINYAQSLIDEFYKPDSAITIAVSVDMMDTGIDVPDVLNLVFFKRVFSQIKFWQMIGRGTRICKDLYVVSPGRDYFEKGADPVLTRHKDKQGFYIFDFCDVFEFFRMNPDGRQPKTALNLSQKLFELKLDLVCELQKRQHQENEEHKGFYLKYREELIDKIRRLNQQLINVRLARRYVDKYSIEKSWEYINPLEAREIKKQLTPLIDPDMADESAKLFDLWIFNMELAYIAGDKDYSKAVQKVTDICSSLLEMLTVPVIAAKKEFLETVLKTEFWENISLTRLEQLRKEVRDLLQYLDRPKREIITSDFTDFVIDKPEGQSPVPQFKDYRRRVEDYLTENVDKGAVAKIHNLEQLTQQDIEELQTILWQQLGTKDDYESIAQGLDLGAFVRQIVGLDKEVISKLFSEYMNKYNFNAAQQEFLHLIVNFVLENGDIEPQDLYDKDPFAYQDYTSVFADTAPLYDFVNRFHSSIMA